MKQGAKGEHPECHRLRWTESEDRVLLDAWGEFGIATIARWLGDRRSFFAIELRARKLGLGGNRHGLLRLSTIAKTTGYDRETIAVAVKVLGLSLQSFPATEAKQQKGRLNKVRRAHRGLDETSLDVLLDYLKRKPERTIIDRPGLKKGTRGAWGVVHGKACADCKTTERPHYARGLCGLCYGRQLPPPEWGVKGRPPACKTCGTTAQPPDVGGECSRCYTRRRRAKKEQDRGKEAAE